MESTLAGKARLLFSETRAAAVTCGIMKPELTPLSSIRKAGRPLILGSTSTASRRSEIEPISHKRHRQDVGGEGDRLGVEIAARQRLVAEQQRIVADRIGLDLERARGVADQVERRAHHLRLAAEAVGVLHPVAIVVASARISLPSSRPRSTAATSIWPGWPRAAWMRGSNGASVPLQRVGRQRAGDQRRRRTRARR